MVEIGVIRWDAWANENPYEIPLRESRWRYRLPWFSENGHIHEDKQEIIDREICLAADAGIGYFAFDFYHWAWDANLFNYGLKFYQSSAQKARLHYCFVVLPGQAYTAGDWEYLDDPQYVRTEDGRPIVYVFPKTDLGVVRTLQQRGAYLVAMIWNPAKVEWADAVSAYSAPDFGLVPGGYSYSALRSANRKFWNRNLALGSKVIPIVNVGWDSRPRDGDNIPWYKPPTMAEWSLHLTYALAWAKAHPCPANTVLLYAWNEFAEGGWLTPTLSEGDARLRAIHSVVGRAEYSRESPAPALA